MVGWRKSFNSALMLAKRLHKGRLKEQDAFDSKADKKLLNPRDVKGLIEKRRVQCMNLSGQLQRTRIR